MAKIIRTVRRWMRPFRPVVEWLYNDDVSYLYRAEVGTVMQMALSLPSGIRPVVCDVDSVRTTPALACQLPREFWQGVRRGRFAFFGLHEEQVVFYSLIRLGPKPFSSHGYPLQPTAHDAFLYCVYTYPDWRRQGIASGMFTYTAQTLAEREVTHISLLINTTNIASYRTYEKGGAQRIGHLTRRCRLGYWSTSYIPLLPEALSGNTVLKHGKSA